MNKTEIYYFTGTGNSLAVAMDIGAKINARLIPAISLLDQDKINTKADVIGFVFPIYDFKPPKIINKFVEKMGNIGSKYIFAVCTYGIMPLNAMKNFSKIITSSGGTLSGGFAVKMPHNGLGSDNMSFKGNEKVFKKSKLKIDKICRYLKAGKNGKLEKNNIFTVVLNVILLLKLIPAIISIFRKVIKSGGWGSLAFYADEKCTGCGICQKLCPVYNIEMVNSRPVWSDKCEGCFACLHWCPEKAVQIGNITTGMKRYHHPEIKLSEIMKQKK
ncbi:MAG: EFR1 family ferrodoxin [Spirochaetes bacterium]|nr:EFR1 family ferrodoxin [Spirochaetota bacterium]